MKINVALNKNKKSLHDLHHDFSTTSNYGFVQPCLCRELNAQDTVNLRLGQIVRLNPMPRPTFGSLKLKTYTSFVKTEDIFHPFASLLSGQAYNGSETRYIPESVPSVPLRALKAYCMMFADFTIYKVEGITTGSQITINQALAWNQGEYGNKEQTFRDQFGRFFSGVFNSDDARGAFSELYSYVAQAFGLSIADLTPVDSQGTWPSSLQEYGAELDKYDEIIVDSQILEAEESGVYYIIGLKYNRFGCALRKLFLGLGYQLNNDLTEVSILPLVAYYKAYFDLFMPNRAITWKDTACFNLMEYLEQNGYHLVCPGDTVHVFDGWLKFLAELLQCYYTINPDYASAHIVGTAGTLGHSPSFSYEDSTGDVRSIGSSDSGSLPQTIGDGNPAIDRPQLRVLNQLTKLYNRATAIGGDIAKYMRSTFNSQYVDEVDSQFLGSQELSLNPEPIFSTNQSQDVSLGEFAGQCLGKDNGASSRIKFTAKSSGFLISFFCIVPDAKMSQGVDACIYHRTRFDFYHPEFDAITLLPTRKAAIYGHNEVQITDLNQSFAAGFGNIPNYTEYKVKNNILSGDLSKGSTRNTYSPFTLDKVLPYRNAYYMAPRQGRGAAFVLGSVDSSIITAGTFWRFIGKFPWFGNFDRIFYNAGSGSQDPDAIVKDFFFDDNFIVQMFVDLKVIGYELPLADSFDTGQFDGDTLSVEKA